MSLPVDHEELMKITRNMIRLSFWSVPDKSRPETWFAKYNKMADCEEDFLFIWEREKSKYPEIKADVLRSELIAFCNDMQKEREADFVNRHERMKAIKRTQVYYDFKEWLQNYKDSVTKQPKAALIVYTIVLAERAGILPSAGQWGNKDARFENGCKVLGLDFKKSMRNKNDFGNDVLKNASKEIELHVLPLLSAEHSSKIKEQIIMLKKYK